MDVLISGAGPAGVSTSLFLSRMKIPHMIIDKATFPRDKICGDALSGKVVHVLNKLDPEIVSELSIHENEYTGSYGISFFAPNGKKLDVPFSTKPGMLKNAPGFISRRINFDNFLFNRLDKNYCTISQNTELLDLERSNSELIATIKSDRLITKKNFKVVVGADGDRSIVMRKLSPLKKNLSHYCAALRAYYSNVKDTHENNFIELHFLKELLPGYFWIFPMNDGIANVGIGMLSEVVSKRKVNLKVQLQEIITNHPVISKRFSGSKLTSEVEGWGLPLGSARRNLSGDNFILTGDAGSLIDPFTGEGIGNALFSGMLAAESITKAVALDKFDRQIFSEYENKLYHHLDKELSLSRGIQKLASHSWLFNLVVNKARKNAMLRETMTSMFDDVDMRARLKKPSFYFKLLFNNY